MKYVKVDRYTFNVGDDIINLRKPLKFNGDYYIGVYYHSELDVNLTFYLHSETRKIEWTGKSLKQGLTTIRKMKINILKVIDNI